jgi:hypothetical protein
MSQVRYVAEGAPARYGEIRDITAQGRSSYAKRQARPSGVASRGHLSAATKGQDSGCRHSVEHARERALGSSGLRLLRSQAGVRNSAHNAGQATLVGSAL